MPVLVHQTRKPREAWGEASDLELLLAIRESADEDAFDELMDRKTRPLLGLLYRIVGDREEARDLLQVTFLRVWEHCDRFDERWSPNTWLYRIASNLAIDLLRSRRSKQERTDSVRSHLYRVVEGRRRLDLSSLQSREVTGILRELSTCLTERQRLVFVLRELEELPSKEVGRILGCRESTVRNHLFSARKTLRKELAARYPEYVRGLRRGGESE